MYDLLDLQVQKSSVEIWVDFIRKMAQFSAFAWLVQRAFP